MDFLEEQINLYNEFPLLLHSPDFIEWEGYLSPQEPSLRIKCCLPFYPELKDMYFECSPAVKNCVLSHMDKLKNCKTLRGFIYAILHVIKSEPSPENNVSLWNSGVIYSVHKFVCDLERVVNRENILEINENFREIKIKYKDTESTDHTLTFSISHDYPRGHITVLEADLPTEVVNGLSQMILFR